MATLREDFIWGGNCSVRTRFSLLSLFSCASDIKWAEEGKEEEKETFYYISRTEIDLANTQPA